MLYNASLQECSVGKIFLDKKVWPITVHGEENSLTPRCPNFQLFKFKGQYSMSICKFTLNSVLDIHFRRSKAKNWFNTISTLFSSQTEMKLNLVTDCQLGTKERWNTHFFNILQSFSNLRLSYSWLRIWIPNCRYTLGMLRKWTPQMLTFARSCFAILHFYLMLLQMLIKTLSCKT